MKRSKRASPAVGCSEMNSSTSRIRTSAPRLRRTAEDLSGRVVGEAVEDLRESIPRDLGTHAARLAGRPVGVESER
jgi:hypothetical protein